MSARDDILAAIGAAFGSDPRPDIAVSRDYRRERMPADIALFVDRVQDYKAKVTRCVPTELVSTVAAALNGTTRVVVPDGLDLAIPGGIADTGLTAADLDAVDAVVTTAAIAIATTGTIVLDHGPGQGRRALSLIPDRHVCVVRVDQVVNDVPDAVARLDATRPQTWISGPSATSDIELSRVEGVHGPRVLHVVLVGNG